jgi:multisubunit Na+/H+ antiporter MnhB subunit
MNLKDYLFTEKQYKKCWSLIITSLVISGIITFAGFLIMVLADNADVIITGLIVGIVGFILLMISGVYVFKNAARLDLYRHFKKHPEDFENDLE